MPLLINLLPQERQSKIKDRRNRVLMVTLSLGASLVLVGVTVLLFVITQAQEIGISRLQTEIDSKQAEFAAIPNVQDMLTVQQNLKSIPALYGQRKAVSRFFKLLEGVSPTDLKVTNLTINQDGKMEVSGRTVSYRLVAKLVKAMEAAGGNNHYFTNVTLPGASGGRGNVNFNLTATISPVVTSVGGNQ